uniref:Uncharacterized protein n=1 Tax=Lactuca sativa TaxID=4236 RepID=A0A9R1W2C2_LACSA|nr:hypothetical protein LSAT_V11C300112520 [Lactuca sativa]
MGYSTNLRTIVNLEVESSPIIDQLQKYLNELPEFYGDFINGTFYGQIITAVGMYLNNEYKDFIKGIFYKVMLLKCASTCNMQYFGNATEEFRTNKDVLLNNMCEVFNRKLVDRRDKPIIMILAEIRFGQYQNSNCVIQNDVQTKSLGDQCVVDVKEIRCSCKRLKLIEIP